MKGDARWRWHDKMWHDNQPVNKRQPAGAVDKKRQRIARQRQCIEIVRGGGGVTTGTTRQPAGKQEANWMGGVSGHGAAEHQKDKRQRKHDKRHHNNQPANKRQRGGRRQWTKRWWCLESWWCLKMTRAAATLVDTRMGEDMVEVVMMFLGLREDKMGNMPWGGC
jgi:hypothetical protein